MKKSERILELMMELEKELESLPKEMSELSDKISDYDTVNSEMYHTLLSFNPSASESAKFVKNWQKALRERLEVKKEFQRLKTLQGQLNSLLKNVSATGSNLKKRILAKGNPFTYRTEIGMKIIEDSFHNFEGRVTHPMVFRGRKTLNSTNTVQSSKNQPLQGQKSLKLNPKPPRKSHVAFIEQYNGKLYMFNAEGFYVVGDKWDDIYDYMKKHLVRSVSIEEGLQRKIRSQIEFSLMKTEDDSPFKKVLNHLLSSNAIKPSEKRIEQIRSFTELNAISLGKYQLPGQSDQQKKSSL